MILTFNGSAVYIYGAKRGNHGLFSGQSMKVVLGIQADSDV